MRKSTLSLIVAACLLAPVASATEEHNPNSNVYRPHSSPYGKSMSTWAERLTQWIYAEPYESNPFFDPTGEFCDVGQEGPVWYLAPIAGMSDGTYTRNCTIPRGKSVLLGAIFYSNTYPCPDPDFEPAPGQSLYRFLREGADEAVDTINLVQVTLDGRPVRRGLHYRQYSENLYSLKGDLTLQSTFDGCITGDWQPATIDGYFMMFKPLSPGQHTINRRITTTSGSDTTYIYNLYVP